MNATKKALIEGRIRKRLRKLNITSYENYYKIVKYQTNTIERSIFIDILTTNETWFFREEKHFDFVTDYLANNDAITPLNIWSAACSSGQEPYSLAMAIEESGSNQRPWHILATDISTGILEKAKQGIYSKERIKGLSAYRQQKFMLNGVRKNNGYVAIVPEIRNNISFETFNLIDSNLPKVKFDIIFCRNVLIYFNAIDKLKVVERLSSCLKTGGYLMTGHSESFHGIYDYLKPVQPSIYQKI